MGSVVLGKQKEAVGEHMGDQMFSAMDGPVLCLVYLQDKGKTPRSARVEKQSPGIGYELGMKLELLLRLWQGKEGWVQLWGTQNSGSTLNMLWLCPEPHSSSLTSVLATMLLWEAVQKNSAKKNWNL